MLKSYRLFKKNKKNKPQKRRRGIGGMIVGGVTAIIGVGLLDQTAQAVGRI